MRTGPPLFDATEGTAETRRKAAARIAPFAHDQKAAVLAFVRAQGRRGAIDQEITETLGICPDSARARRVELVQAGELVDSRSRRPTRAGRAAIVWCTRDHATGPAKPVDRPPRPAAARKSESSTGPAVRQEAAGPSPTEPAAPAEPGAEMGVVKSAGPERCPRCGSVEVRDVRIHDGQSTRRDCRRCGLFQHFVLWNGKTVRPSRGSVMARRLVGDEPAT